MEPVGIVLGGIGILGAVISTYMRLEARLIRVECAIQEIKGVLYARQTQEPAEP